MTLKDTKKLIDYPNRLLIDAYCRVMITNAPETLCSFYEANKGKINAKVVIIRNKSDIAFAASVRNSFNKVLFVFSEKYCVSSYFSSVCKHLSLPNALLNRI